MARLLKASPSDLCFNSRVLGAIFLLLAAHVVSGCAVHYYDPKTGAEHIWGVGYMVMKASVPREGHQAIVRGTEVLGMALGNVGGQGYFTFGWEKRQQVEIVDENTAIRLEWPKGDFFNVRVGSDWPRILQEPNSNSKGANQ